MQVVAQPFRTHVARAAITAAGLMALLNARPESTRLAEAAAAGGTGGTGGTVARKLILSDQARRYLALQYRSYPTEFMGCMIGEAHGGAVVVRRIAPADVDPAQSAPTHVVPTTSCEQAGWAGTVGVIHSHPDGQHCWYYFPGTEVLSSDGQSFARQPYALDAIMCGDRVVWISRDMRERQLSTVSAPGQSNGRAPL
ncbi:MAG: hypothetical protein AUH07_04145 [Gemmatimonadetes bacterium 13_2_20CM_70_9]|nr:MAG: hypothetical protein AUH07_04145 [Gemmatimonadetes bacterium 13_2_20CM_70_9]